MINFILFCIEWRKIHWSRYVFLCNSGCPQFNLMTSNVPKWQNDFRQNGWTFFTWVCWLRWLPRGEGRHPKIWAPSHPLALDQYTKTINKQNDHRLNVELDFQSLFGLHVQCLCTAVLIGWGPATTPRPRIWAHILVRGRYWSAKIDDISLWPPENYT